VRDLPIWWLTSRATGIVGYLALVGSIVAGLASKARLGQRATSPLGRLEWHKVLAITGLMMTAAHALTLLGSARGFSVADVLLPGAMDYRSIWMTLGVIAFWLMITVAITGSMRARLGPRAWKTIHLSSYGVFVGATLHGLFGGTDSGRVLMMLMYSGSAGVVAALLTRRLVAPPAPVRRPARNVPGATTVNDANGADTITS